MKKKILILALAALFVSVGTMGTLAFHTTEEQTHNVITTGAVEIGVLETVKAEDGTEQSYPEEAQGVMPSKEKSKIVRIENKGTVDAWVRVKVDFVFTAEKPGTVLTGKNENGMPLVTIDNDTENWTDGEDGYYYYNKVLKPGEKTEPLFEHVKFSHEIGNDYQGATINVAVAARGVQSKNNGTTVMEAQGWPNEKN